MKTISIPDFALVMLVGVSSAGKSSFARQHFKSTEVISSDYCRGLVADDENDQSATPAAFEVLEFIVRKRLAARRLTVIDATNIRPEDRKVYVNLAREYYAPSVALILNPPESVCHERNKQRTDRSLSSQVIHTQYQTLKRGFRGLYKERIKVIYEWRSVQEIASIERIERIPLWPDKRHETGAFDIIGDIHGCYTELTQLLTKLGYRLNQDTQGFYVSHAQARKLVFVGDLVDRGNDSPAVLRLVMDLVKREQALCALGNHEAKLLKWLNGRDVKLTHGLEQTVAQLQNTSDEFKAEVRKFLDSLISHYWLDNGKLAVAHAGIKENMIGRASSAVKAFCMFGETTGETDEFGLPVRYPWAMDYRGKTTIVYGHTPTPQAEWLNNTICLDTGCVFGGKLTALRYPEMELCDVPALAQYAEPARPLGFNADALNAQQAHDDVLDFADVSGKRILSTTLRHKISVREENAAAALEVMSRFAVNPRWLIYLPPTMSPSETSERDGYLEYPSDAFAYFARHKVAQVVCEEKHMGSRAVIVVCRDADTAAQRFGVTTGESGVIYTRTGRHFFNDTNLTQTVLQRLQTAISQADLWASLQSDWLCLDVEIMPWSAKAQALIQEQYAPVGAAARIGLNAALQALQRAAARGVEMGETVTHFQTRLEAAQHYGQAWEHYCWSVQSVNDLRIAPFHLLASEGAVHTDKPHTWHMQTLAKLAATGDALFMATQYRVVDVNDAKQVTDACEWWENLTAQGGEGMVIKPLDFIANSGQVQPALKCRGKHYLRIIYGAEYDLPANLQRLRKRGLHRKRALALQEFALGHEALTRFVKQAPLRQVHECVFALLALETEPVDPRL
jgi:protein phosphatase